MKMTMNPCATAACAAVLLMSASGVLQADETNEWEWVEARDFGVAGMPFKDAVTPYGRLPKGFAGASGWVRRLGRLSTGLSLRFAVDDNEVRLKCEIDPECWKEATSGHYMTTFVNIGFDWYVWDGKRGEWVYENHLWPSKKDGSTDGVIRTRPGVPTLVNFPVRGEPLSVKIGVRRGHRLTRITSHKLAQKPVVHYGTSIVQGGCVSRPGLLFTAAAARQADVEGVNLGFSGAARMEMDMCTGVVARVDASLYILDCLWNMDGKMVSERCEPFVRELRRLRPDVPILLCEDVQTDRRETRMGLMVRKLHKKLVAEGWKWIYLLRTDEILPMDPDMTVDRCHPNDIGARIMAQVYADRVRKILGVGCESGE